MRTARLANAILLALLLGGCAVGPNYKRPELSPPPVFRGAGTETNSLGDMAWWDLFKDPTLQKMIRVALTNNFDLRIAESRVEQAQAIWMENRSLFLPQVNYAGGAGYAKNVLAGSPAHTGGKPAGGFLGDVNLSWEIDLFGRIRRLNESARAQYFATDEARHDMTALLVADVAQAYFQLLTLDQEYRIARDSTNSFGQSLKIFSERFRGGVDSKLEVSAAQALMAAATTSALDLKRQIVAQEDLICVLLGTNAAPIERGGALLAEESLPDVPPGLPSAILERRPDVREAEQNLRSANAQVGVAKADFFPRLQLTGLLGASSSDLTQFTAGANRAWEIAAGLTGPIFEGGALKAQYRAAKAAWDEERFSYASTILQAFREVADALAARQQLAAEREEQIVAVAAYEEAVKLANELFTHGQANYYEVLQQQQQLFPAEDTLAQIQFQQLQSEIQLYRALGGGWSNQPEPPTK
jgi:multidrug efflux system outer membrane protein